MYSKHSFRTLLFLMTLIALLITSTSTALSQSVDIEISVEDLKETDRAFQERAILKTLVAEQTKVIAELEKSLALKEKELELEQRENVINTRMLEVKDREIAGLIRNFDQMKEVADRAIKLAEVGKPKSNWELQGLLGLAAFAIGMLVK